MKFRFFSETIYLWPSESQSVTSYSSVRTHTLFDPSTTLDLCWITRRNTTINDRWPLSTQYRKSISDPVSNRVRDILPPPLAGGWCRKGWKTTLHQLLAATATMQPVSAHPVGGCKMFSRWSRHDRLEREINWSAGRLGPSVGWSRDMRAMLQWRLQASDLSDDQDNSSITPCSVRLIDIR